MLTKATDKPSLLCWLYACFESLCFNVVERIVRFIRIVSEIAHVGKDVALRA